MAVNRFTEITPSTYTPQSLEELAFVPLMKRKKHDEILAKQQDIISGLAKVDPYDKHFDEAIRLKNELESKIDQTASELATNGFNNDMVGKTIALNREYQNLISPTGRIGQINAEKQNILKINEEYDKLGKEKGWSQEITNYWKQKAIEDYNQTPIYDDNGRILKYTGPEGIANKIDYNKYLQDLATNAKMSTNEFASAVAGLSKDEASGYSVVNKSSYAHKLGDNYAAVKAAYDTLKQSMDDPTSEVYKSMKYEQRDPKALLDILNTQSGVYKQSVKSTETGQDINPFGNGPDKTNTDASSTFGEDYNSTEIGGKDSDSYDQIRKVGTTDESLFNPSNYHNKIHTFEDIKDPKQKALFQEKWNELTTKGVVIDGKKTFISAAGKKNGMSNRKNVELIIKALEQHPITLTSRLLTTDQVLNSQGFVAGLGDKTEDIDKNIRRQISRDDASGRKLVDPKTHKVISWNEAVDEYDLDDISNVKYQGQISAHNWEDTSHLGTNSRFSPHVITAKDKDGKWHSFQTTRLSSDNIGGNVARQNDLQDNFRTATVAHGSWVNFKSSSKNFKGIKIKYDPSTTEVDEKSGEPKLWSIKFSNGKEAKATESQYMNWVNSVK